MSDLVGNSEDRFSHNEAQITDRFKVALPFWLSVVLLMSAVCHNGLSFNFRVMFSASCAPNVIVVSSERNPRNTCQG